MRPDRFAPSLFLFAPLRETTVSAGNDLAGQIGNAA
jgi:hypothetical protein